MPNAEAKPTKPTRDEADETFFIVEAGRKYPGSQDTDQTEGGPLNLMGKGGQLKGEILEATNSSKTAVGGKTGTSPTASPICPRTER